jgi:hypothetical protein
MYAPVCHLCGRADALQMVGNIIDGGTTHTSGMGVTIGIGQTLAAPTYFMSNSTTALAQRFSPPKFPGQPHPFKLIGYWAICTLAWATIFSDHNLKPFTESWLISFVFSLVYALLPGIILAFVVAWAVFFFQKKRVHKWNVAYHTLRYSFYCGRCDMISSADSVGSPDDFINHLFFNSVRVYPNALDSSY